MLHETRQEVFKYMTGILRHHKCKSFIINGVEDHVHILTHLHPSVALSALVQSIKISSHTFIDRKGLFPGFTNWQDGYGAFTYDNKALPNLYRYIENQERHHGISFEEEYISLLKEHGVEYDEKYVFD